MRCALVVGFGIVILDFSSGWAVGLNIVGFWLPYCGLLVLYYGLLVSVSGKCMDHGFKILCTLDVVENILETKFYVQEIRISSHELQQGGRRSKRNYPRTCSSDSLPKCLFISFYLSDFTYPIFPFCNRPNLRKKGPFRVYILFSPQKKDENKERANEPSAG